MSPTLHIVLYCPEIPQNTGNIGRLCLGAAAALHLVHPLGFSTDAKAVRRAGLDYWRHVDLTEHPSTDAFWDWARGRRIVALSRRAEVLYTRWPWERGDVLLFGRETVGLPDEVLARVPSVRIPMVGPTRSLNLANAAAVVTYQALQGIEPAWF